MKPKQFRFMCIKPTKTLRYGNVYRGIPCRKKKSHTTFNGRYTTRWENCGLADATSIKVSQRSGWIATYSLKRFNLVA